MNEHRKRQLTVLALEELLLSLDHIPLWELDYEPEFGSQYSVANDVRKLISELEDDTHPEVPRD